MPNLEYAWTGSLGGQISALSSIDSHESTRLAEGKCQYVSTSPAENENLWSARHRVLDPDDPIRALRLPLSLVPLDLDEALVITALEARSEHRARLHIKPAALDASRPWQVTNSAAIYTRLDAYYDQLQAVRSDLQRVASLSEATVYAGKDKPEGFTETIIPSTAEVCPPTSCGIMAWITAPSDSSMRRLLLALHDADTAARSNVERQTAQLYQHLATELLGCHCSVPRPGVYMLDVASRSDGIISHHRVRHSTASTLLGELRLLM